MPSARQPGKHRRQVESDDEHSDDDALLTRLKKVERVDVQYLNQPVDRGEGTTTIKTMISELKATRTALKEMLDSISTLAVDVAESLAQGPQQAGTSASTSLKDDPPAIKQLDTDYRACLDRIREIEIKINSLEQLVQRISYNDTGDVATWFEEQANKSVELYNAHTPRQRYARSEQYHNFRAGIWETLYDDLAFPGLSKLLPKEAADEGAEDEDDDDEVAVEGSKENFQCPLTLTLFDDPVKNESCGHHYSRKPIEQLIRQAARGEATQCPYSGCRQYVTLSSIKEDRDMKRRTEAYARRQKETAARTQSATQFETISSDTDDE